MKNLLIAVGVIAAGAAFYFLYWKKRAQRAQIEMVAQATKAGVAPTSGPPPATVAPTGPKKKKSWKSKLSGVGKSIARQQIAAYTGGVVKV